MQTSQKLPDKFPFLLLGNKIDLGEDTRVVPRSKAENWCKNNGNAHYIETSAKVSSQII